MDNKQLLMIVVIVMLLMIIFRRRIFEHLENSDSIFTGGANMRVMAQEFSGTNQGSRDVIYNKEIPLLM